MTHLATTTHKPTTRGLVNAPTDTEQHADSHEDNAWTVDGRYYASEADAAFWRRVSYERKQSHAARVAAYLARHPEVAAVLYPAHDAPAQPNEVAA